MKSDEHKTCDIPVQSYNWGNTIKLSKRDQLYHHLMEPAAFLQVKAYIFLLVFE